MSKDTIYREDAIKTLKENVMFEFTEDEEWATTCLQNLPSADRPQGWIPCRERLPKDLERVLATINVDELGVIIMPACDVKSWYRKGYVSAWMPLPKPWKGVDNESVDY